MYASSTIGQSIKPTPTAVCRWLSARNSAGVVFTFLLCVRRGVATPACVLGCEKLSVPHSTAPPQETLTASRNQRPTTQQWDVGECLRTEKVCALQKGLFFGEKKERPAAFNFWDNLLVFPFVPAWHGTRQLVNRMICR